MNVLFKNKNYNSVLSLLLGPVIYFNIAATLVLCKLFSGCICKTNSFNKL